MIMANDFKKLIINIICVLLTVDVWLIDPNYVLYAVCGAFAVQFILDKIYIKNPHKSWYF